MDDKKPGAGIFIVPGIIVFPFCFSGMGGVCGGEDTIAAEPEGESLFPDSGGLYSLWPGIGPRPGDLGGRNTSGQLGFGKWADQYSVFLVCLEPETFIMGNRRGSPDGL